MAWRIYGFLIIPIAAVGVFFAAAVYFTEAAQPYMMISWEPEKSYVPPGYQGKALPTPFTPVTVKAEVFQDGKAVSLAQKTVRWYVDDYAETQGKGITSFTLPAVRQANKDAYEVRVEVLDFTSNFTLSKSIVIPIVSPQVVIRGGTLRNIISPGTTKFTATPYYFNVSRPDDLRYGWKLNGVLQGEDKSGEFNLSVLSEAKGRSAEVQVSAYAPENKFDSASEKQTFLVQ